MSPATVRRVLVDTDAGTDPDDLLALALLAGREDVELVGVTTVYGDTVLRARIVRALLALCGRGDVPVVAGARRTLSGAEVWWAGHEGDAWAHLLPPALPGDGDDEEAAARFLVRTVAADPGGVDVVGIAPLTNLALAVRRSPGLADRVRHLWLMGGDFSGGPALGAPEHNVRSDVVAAVEVLGSSAPTTLTGLDITRQVATTPADADRIAGAGPAGAVLASELRAWWDRWHEGAGVPHDPVALLPALHPDLVTLGPAGRVEVDGSGAVRHRPGAGGTQQVASAVDAAGAARAVHDGVVAGLLRGRPLSSGRG